MGEPFLSEIKLISFNYAPRGWALCNGQLLPINQNQALFSLLGTNYGGNGQTTFGLPNLQGRVPLHMSGSFALGQAAGEAFHTLVQNEMPQHTHSVNVESSSAIAANPSSARILSKSTGSNLYADPNNLTPMAQQALAAVGSNQIHENRQPFLTVSFIIALQGIFPSRN